MILLWGVETDAPLAAVRRALAELGLDPVFLDQQAALDTQVELYVDSRVSGAVRSGRLIVDLGAITAAYLRPYDPLGIPSMARVETGSSAWSHVLDVTDILLSWADVAPGLIVNRPAAMAPNNSKPYQAAQIRAAGFYVPEMLLTNDPIAARQFQEIHGSVVYKSTSGIRSIVSRLTPAHHSRIDDVRWCPTLFQRYIAGQEYRVHVVADAVFACEILSSADDYRYASRQQASVELRSCVPPDDLAERCRALADSLHLTVAGIDLRLGLDRRWYCLEVNPSPGFTFYDRASDEPIARAVARLLVSRA